jgi:hypothetical protein
VAGSGVLHPSGAGALTTRKPQVVGEGTHSASTPVTGTGALTLTVPTLDGSGLVVVPSGIGTIYPDRMVAKPFPSPWPAPPVHIIGRGSLSLPHPAVAGMADNAENEDWLLLM